MVFSIYKACKRRFEFKFINTAIKLNFTNNINSLSLDVALKEKKVNINLIEDYAKYYMNDFNIVDNGSRLYSDGSNSIVFCQNNDIYFIDAYNIATLIFDKQIKRYLAEIIAKKEVEKYIDKVENNKRR